MSGVAWGVADYDAHDDASTALATTRRAGPAVEHDDTPALMEAVADALITLQFRTWDFGDSVAFDALITASNRLGLERWASFAHGWGRSWATRSRPFARLDCTVPGRALTLIAERRHDDQLVVVLRDLAAFLRRRRTLSGVYETWDSSPLLQPYGAPPMSSRDRSLLEDPPAGVFVDCMHFDPPFFTALGRVAADDDLVADGVRQARGYIDLLQGDRGLFDHFVLRDETGSFGPGWGRGQGWAALGLIEVIRELRARRSEGGDRRFDQDEERCSSSLVRLLDAMVNLQRADGHWEVVVHRSGSGDEYSTAGFMAYALSEACELGLGDTDRYAGAALAARTAVLRSLDAAGQLREVSAAVYASTVLEHYAAVPRGYVVPWGQGPALLALVSNLKRGNES